MRYFGQRVVEETARQFQTGLGVRHGHAALTLSPPDRSWTDRMLTPHEYQRPGDIHIPSSAPSTVPSPTNSFPCVTPDAVTSPTGDGWQSSANGHISHPAAAAAVNAMMDQMSKAWLWKLQTGEATVKQLVDDLESADPMTVRVRNHIVQDLVQMMSNPSMLPQPTFGLVTSLLGELIARGLATTYQVSGPLVVDNQIVVNEQQQTHLHQYSRSQWPSSGSAQCYQNGQFAAEYQACPLMGPAAQSRNMNSRGRRNGRTSPKRGAGS